MIEAGVIGVKAGWDDTEARAAAQKYATDMKALMASVGSGGPAPAGGGFFNRVGGGGQVSGAAPGGGGGGNIRFPSFDAEGAQLRGGMLALSRAMFTQANALNTMTGSLRGSVAAAAPMGGTGGGAAPAAGGGDSGFNPLAGFGRKFAALFAIREIVGLIGAGRDQSLSNEGLDRKLALGDFGGAISEQLSDVKQARKGVSGWARQNALPDLGQALVPWGGVGRFAGTVARNMLWGDDEKAQSDLEKAQLVHQANIAQDQARRQIVVMQQHNALLGLGSYNAAYKQAGFAQVNASSQADVLRQLANQISVYDPQAAKSLLVRANTIEGLGGDEARGIRAAANQQANTIGMGLRFGIDVQREENKLHPGQAHALELFAHASESIRAMLINSSPANAELARQLGIEQLTGDRIQTIMSGRGSSFDPTAELVGPQFGSGSEQVADILKRIEDLVQKLTSESLGDLGETNNPN